MDKIKKIFKQLNSNPGTWHSTLSIVTNYGLEGPGFKLPWGEIFPNHADWPPGSPGLLYNGYQLSFQWVKQSGHSADHSHTLLALKLKKE